MKNFFIEKHNKNESGNVMIITMLLFVAITLSMSFGLVVPVIGSFTDAKNDIKSKASYALSESGIEDALYRIAQSKNLSSTETLVLGSTTATTTITDLSTTQKQIKTVSVLSNFNRIVTSVAVKSTGVTLSYGAITGSGGITLNNGARIVGSVYANGPIVADNSGVTISGAATSTTSISGVDQWNRVSIGTGGTYDAWAPTLTAVSATGNMYCTTGTNNSKTCNTSKGTPATQTMPISDTQLADWQSKATTITTGNVSVTGSSTLTTGNRKIVGNLIVDNSGVLTLTGPLWVTGTLTVQGSGRIQLSSSFGSSSGVLLVDGKTNIDGSGTFAGSGTTGSYLLLISTSDCPTSSSCSGSPAVSLTGGSGSLGVIAQNGTVRFTGGSVAKQVSAKTITMVGGVNITYDTGFSTLSFSGSGAGGWAVSSWQETGS